MTDNTFPSSPAGAPPQTQSQYSNAQLERAKQQVEDVKGIMGQNVQRIMERGENLDNLDRRAETLTENANEFQRTSRTLKRKMWWQNLKMMLILGAITVVVIIVIIVAAVGFPSGGGSGGSSTIPTVPPPTGAVNAVVPAEEQQANSISKRSVMDVLYEKATLKDPGA